MTTQEQYEQMRAENQRKWAARRKRKEDMETIASTTIGTFDRVIVVGHEPETDRERWIKTNPQTTLAYVDALMKRGSYWDTESLALSVDDVANNVDR